MYEFAFKPRRELILKTEPYLNKRFNAEQHDLGEMQAVEGEEAEKMKGFLQLFAPEGVTSAFADIQDLDALSVSGQGRNQGIGGSFINSHIGGTHDHSLGASVDHLAQASSFQDPTVDWNKVGRIYKPNEHLENILEREMSRLKIVMDKKIAAQDIELEEKALVARGKKK
jgi:hypothetical protein